MTTGCAIAPIEDEQSPGITAIAIDHYHSGMGAIRPWHLLVLLTIVMILGGAIGAALWSASRNDRQQ